MCPARVHPDMRFTCYLERAGEVLDARLARNGHEAIRAAIMILCEVSWLEHGDRLIVMESPPDMPEPTGG